MYDKITGDDVTVQIESSFEDNWVPEGIAVSQGIYDLPLVEDPASVTPMGMNKSGNVTLGNSWVDITGWTAMGSLPGTVIDSNTSLVVAETGSIMVKCLVDLTSGWFSFNLWSSGMIRIVLNDEIVATKLGRNSVTINKVLNVIAGDKIRIQGKGVRKNDFADWPVIDGSGTKIEFAGYDNSAIDFEEGMCYANDVGFYDDTWGRYVSTSHLKAGLPAVRTGGVTTSTIISGSQEFGYSATSNSYTTLSRGSASGPILAQTRIPQYVHEGSTVSWDGTFRVRRTGGKDEQTDEGVKTGLDVRFSVWGIGITTDEYGVESMQSTEIMFYQATLQAANVESTSMIEYTLPVFPEPATVPADVEYLFFTCSIVQVVSELYSAATFSEKKSGADQQPPAPASSSEMKYFGWKHDNPLKLTITPPSSVRRVSTHPLSRTGVAYKNAEIFTNVKENAEITFFGFPGQATSIDVYNYDTETSTQGSLIGTYSVLENETKTVSITPTGTAIKIAKDGANDYYIESVINERVNTLSNLKTPIRSSNFMSVNDDIAKISIIREESDTGTATIDFCSNDLDPFTSSVLSPGKMIRILGRHYDEGDQTRPGSWVGESDYSEIFTGVVRQIKTEYDYEDEPIIQVICYDAGDNCEKTKPGVAFDTYEKYIPFFNKLGINVLVNGFNVGGKFEKAPNKFMYRPSSYGEYEIAKSLSMTRNTLRGYTFVNRFNELELLTEAKTSTPFVFTDGTQSGDISYGQISKKTDTNSIVNQLELIENCLDAEDLRSKRIGGEDGPPADIRYPSEKKRTATFTNNTSVQEYGELSKSIEVVRGDGDLNRLYRNDIGEGFTEWATVLLDQNSIPQLVIEDISVPIKGSDDIRKLSNIDLLDPVTVVYKNTTYTTKIREIEHTIIPGKWFVEYKFTTSGDMTLW